MFCSGHSPPRSQIGQSSGWFASRNSSIPFCAFLTSGASVRITMPSATGTVQQVNMRVCFAPNMVSSMLTRHMRHAPTLVRRGGSRSTDVGPRPEARLDRERPHSRHAVHT
jgi:hypothetical protein